MKRYSCFLLAVFFLLTAKFSAAQITTDPVFPVATKKVTITFDATQGTAGLKDFTGDVYAHTGVITDKSTTPSDWKYVIAAWNTNLPKVKLTRVSTNIYTLEIIPDIRSFYGVPSGETIQQMAFVFRNSDGSKEGKATGGMDIFVNVYQEGLVVSLNIPADQALFDKNTPFLIAATSSQDAALKLSAGSTVLTETTGKTISISHAFSDTGWKWIIAEAKTTEKTVLDSIRIFVKEPVTFQTKPSGYLKGINYTGDNSVALVLWAPFKNNVFVLGDFNNWEVDNNYQMKKDGDYFWLEINGLITGQPYAFQYLVDGQIRIADPFSNQTSDPNDQYIPAATYPGLVAYPSGKADGVASVLQTGQTPYHWGTTTFTPPAKEKLVIYETLIRDFTTDHTYQSVIGKLDYLKELGINVLELMPVNEFEGNVSWGYNPSFYFAPDKYYGPKNDLKKLVDEAHKRGMAVVIDLVLNHSYGQSPLVRMYWDAANNRPAIDNPWYNVQSNFQNPSAQWGYDFNHESIYTRQLVDSINSFWMKEYKVDGFRFDFTKGFSNTSYGISSWGSDYDASRIANLKRMADEIWTRNDKALVIFEHLSDNAEEKELADYGILLWGNMSGKYSEGAMGYNESSKSDLSWGIFSNRSWKFPNLVSYMESHDEERLVYKCLMYGKEEGSYSTKQLNTALDRAELSSLFFLPMPGPKMIWQFGELGYDYSINTCENPAEVRNECRLTPKPVLWNYFDQPNRKDLYKMMGRLNYLKVQYDEFASASTFSGNLTGETKWYRLSHGSNHVVVAGNFATSAKTVTLNFPETGAWYDYFQGTQFSVPITSQNFTLAPGEFRLFTTRQMTDPFAQTGSNLLIDRLSDLMIYPNPAHGKVNIESGKLLGKVVIRAISGVEVFQRNFSGSRHEEINLDNLAPGIYLIQAGNSVKKLVKY